MAVPLSSFSRRLSHVLSGVVRRLRIFRSVQCRFGVSDVIQEVLKNDYRELRDLSEEELERRLWHRYHCWASKLQEYHS